ncbi:lysozyme inhibitor LprI family protein [Acinetobacter amyesii]|uniref:lysozyme inhibitor LprI family protein n=2 Tax=Acinetobacter amyesii TaxID=2942470 RepID=UPI0020BED325|nr:lysozyme inhibitor LprI family protein [Acinetobacter amyesii]
MKKIFLLLVLPFISSFTFAKCKASNVYDEIACYEKELQFNKTKLNQTYQKLYNTMNEEGQKILETSQKNWLLYKNSHCNELVSYLSSGV